MKSFFFLLLFPFVATAQTIHFDDENIVYQGKVSLSSDSPTAIFSRLQSALLSALGKEAVQTNIRNAENAIVTTGEIKMNTPYSIIRNLHFTIQLTAEEGGYTYRIDSVSVKEKRRGGKWKEKSSEKLLEGIEETGTVAIETEILLNEIDMRFQKLLAILQNNMKLKVAAP